MTNVVQPEGAFWLLRKNGNNKLIKVEVSVFTLKITDEQEYDQAVDNWTPEDIEDLLNEGERFFGID
ncbi:hypothetical protein [Paenibacillus sp. FSL P4-0288]|uniref:hypothetical protein n=1 Tax=Paenibacillus sp. FSL P4-0288 TaxID=2921633 RepID=UPI0030F963CF